MTGGRYGRINQEQLTDILITDANVHHQVRANHSTPAGHVTQSSPLIGPQEISGLEKGIEYEFRVAGVNTVGPGQETIKYYLTPEG